DAVVVDDIPLDERIADDAVAAFGAVAVHVDAAPAVAPEHIAADHRAIAAVADVDAVLLDAARRDVVLDQHVVAEAGEDSEHAALIDRVVAHGHVLAGHRA